MKNKNRLHFNILLILFFFFGNHLIFSQEIKDISDTCSAGFRGLSVVNDSLIWLGGTKGTVGISNNGGKKWKWIKVKNHTTLDFRSIYGFDEKRAVIANAGFPATILITDDGGENWKQVYRSFDSSMFFDGMDFWDNEHGIIFGDPVKGKMFVAETKDGGKTWKEIPNEKRPLLETGEASFAASGTTIRTFPKSKIIIASGGKISRLWYSENFGTDWTYFKTPIMQGSASTGIFSFAVSGKKIIIVGGDYTSDSLKKDNNFIGTFPGKKFSAPKVSTQGYYSCVELVSKTSVYATGPLGTEVSLDSGNTWKVIDKTSYNCVRKARNGNAIYFCGAKGKLGKLILKQKS
ncbi:MAG: oxidoreductase [Bacteroidia bacterium]|nr:oxidoreductase [Bacteroidia bacterium]